MTPTSPTTNFKHPVYCFCQRPSMADLICYINGADVLFPDNWPGGAPRKVACNSISEIQKFIEEEKADAVMFGIYELPRRPVKVLDAEKLQKAFRKLERILK